MNIQFSTFVTDRLLGETIPIRLFLGGFDLTPTFREVNKKFSTRYYLNLVLIDEENRRYFKQQVYCIFLHLFTFT
jgi:vacuolar protein sorting-associated protein 26